MFEYDSVFEIFLVRTIVIKCCVRAAGYVRGMVFYHCVWFLCYVLLLNFVSYHYRLPRLHHVQIDALLPWIRHAFQIFDFLVVEFRDDWCFLGGAMQILWFVYVVIFFLVKDGSRQIMLECIYRKRYRDSQVIHLSGPGWGWGEMRASGWEGGDGSLARRGWGRGRIQICLVAKKIKKSWYR